MKYLVGAAVAIAIAILGGGAFVMVGGFNVAATDPHAGLTRWVLNTAMARSASSRASSIKEPAHFTPEQVQSGFTEFNEMCVTCHGAPGKEVGEIGKGLNPPPPDLSQHAAHWSDAELFWIIKNGIKMTGMPAFGPTHSDDRLWTLVAFVKKLPQLSPAEYEKMEEAPSAPHEHPVGSDHQHDHKN